MKTKLLALVMLLMLSASTFGQLKTIATMTVADDRTNDVRITVIGVEGKSITINGQEPYSIDSDSNFRLFEVSVSANKTIKIEAEDASYLIGLSCRSSSLISLDVSGLIALEELNCSRNLLTSLDLSDLVALRGLNCSRNLLTSLDVSSLVALEYLSCFWNSLTSLNISDCVALEYLSCHTNFLTSLDVSGFAALEYLDCFDNDLTSLNISDCIALEYLNCAWNSLTVLEFSDCVALEELSCHRNSLVSLDVSACVALRYLSAGEQEVVVEVPFNYNRSDADIYFNGTAHTFYEGRFSIPTDVASGTPFAGTLSIVRAADAPTSNEQLTAASISTGVGEITIETATSASIQIVSISGKVVYSANASGTTSVNVPAGIYIVVVDGKSTKVVVR
jgi:hypothetical protein